MITIQVKTTEGKDLGQLNVPTNLKEVRLRQYIDLETFLVHATVNKESLEDVVKWMCNAMQAFFGNDKVSHLTLGKIGEELLNEQGQQSLSWVHKSVVKLIQKRPKQTFKVINWKGYEWNEHTRDAVLGRIVLDKLPTWKAIEVLGARRFFESRAKEDVNGSFKYSYLITLAAILAKKEGESFPEQETEALQLVNRRMAEFQQMPMDVALLIEDFFFNTGKVYKKTNASNTSLIRQNTMHKQKKKDTRLIVR